MSKFQGKILVGGGDLIATVDYQSYQVTREHPMYKKLMQAFKDDDADTFLSLYDARHCMETYVRSEAPTSTGVTVSGEQVYYNGSLLDNSIVDTIREMMQFGLDFKPMLRFLERAIKSDRFVVVEQLVKFLKACGCTITEDGCFLGYKSVRSDYMDKHSGTICNQVGAEIPRKERWEVDDDPNSHCSKGYHVGALAYAGPGGTFNGSGDHVMICKVAPEDVVSVPNDYSGQKLRCCWYEVVAEFQGELKAPVYSGKVGGNYTEGVVPRQARIELDAEDMVVDGVYTAMYTNSMKEQRTRYFVVLETEDNYVLVELMEPEDNAGKIRRFNYDRLDRVFEWDGDVEEVEEEEECCDYCSDCDCNGRCDEEEEDGDYDPPNTWTSQSLW